MKSGSFKWLSLEDVEIYLNKEWKLNLVYKNSHELARKILIRHSGYVKNRTWTTNVNFEVAQGKWVSEV